jgi:aspartate/tyrosine/aromatic aminotransferase
MSKVEQSQDWTKSDLSKISFPLDQIERTDFCKSKFGDKLFLGAGEIQGENNQTYQFDVVKKAEERVYSQTWTEDYLPPEGDKEFLTLARNFLFGVKNLEGQIEKQIVSFQTLGATGAIRLAFSFIKKHLDGKIFIPKFTWPLAKTMAEEVGLSFEEFDLFDISNHEINFQKLTEMLKKAPKNSFIFLQDNASIPNGIDLSVDQWTQIFKIVKENQMCFIIDSAFHGYSTGDFESDSQVVRLLLQENLPFFIAQSFSKNLGLYAERIGCLHVNLFEDPEKITRLLEEKVKLLWLSPSVHGARIVKTILQDSQLTKQWKLEFLKNFSRIKEIRELLQGALIKHGVLGNWQNLTKQNGIFLFFPLNKKQIELMKEKYHIYNLDICRINLSSLKKVDIDRLARGLKEVTEYNGL